MYFHWVSILYFVASVGAALPAIWPGPATTTTVNGEEVFIASQDSTKEPTTYKVRDYGSLRPKLVYNCHYVAALCNNARQYLPAGTSTKQFHYDRLRSEQENVKSRLDERRATVCGGSWIDTPRTDGRAGPGEGRCPEKDQPDWWYQTGTKDKGNKKAVGPNKPIMYQNEAGVVDNNRLAKIVDERDTKNPGQTKTVYRGLGAVMSCDEFPAASWIEGGSTGGAQTYCAPIAQACKKPIKATATQAEQNWQAGALGNLAAWFKTLCPEGHKTNFDNDPLFTIFKFDFEMKTDANDPDALYIEANGRKRYSSGPNDKTYDPKLRPEEVPNNPAIPA